MILRVDKKLWLTAIETIDTQKIFGWTTIEPSTYIGHIEKDSTLIFTRLSPYIIASKQPLEFMAIGIGPVQSEYPVELFEDEIDILTKEGALKLLETEDIDEMTITLTGLGEAFVKYPKTRSFDSPVLLLRDLYIVMGSREENISGKEIPIGEKVSLRHILDIYSKVVRDKLILK